MSIKSKIIISVVVTEAILLFILVTSLYQYTKIANERALNDYITTTERLLVTTTKDAIISFDLATLESTLEDTLRNEKIAYIRILDAANNVLAVKGGAALDNEFLLDTDYHHVNDGIYDSRVIVDVDGFNYGSIEIGFDTKPFQDSLYRLIQIAAVIIVFELILVIVFSLLLGSVLTKQLKVLRNAARNIAKGDYSRLVSVKSHDEVQEVAHAFNSMIINLRDSEKKADAFREELLDLNKDLEARVERRTEKITAQKNKLEEAYENLSLTKEQLIKSEKMASIGQLAAGVAHEINNPIAFIKGNLNSLKKYIETYKHLLKHYSQLITAINAEDQQAIATEIELIHQIEEDEDLEFINDDVLELLSESIEGTARVQEIVKGLKTYSHSANDELEPTDLNSCLEDTLKMLNNEIKYQCDVVTELMPLPMVNCNRGQMIQVFTNLIVNAGHAMENHGTLTVKSRLIKEKENTIAITISDTGVGIPEANLAKLFDPFFTTKPVGQGTGLGLSISQGIIEDHHGTMSVDSTVGIGTTFSIHLPVAGE